jgi:uncharacterized membrane protein YhaH (DUF805 family)
MKDRLFEGLRLGLRTYARIFDFRGRATRTEVVCFWVTVVLISGIGQIIGFILGIPGDLLHPFNARLPQAIGLLALEHLPLLPVFALTARRLHDMGLPGWPGPINALVALVIGCWNMLSFRTAGIDPPSLGWEALHVVSVLLFYLGLFWAPMRGPNRYGPDPRAVETA